MMRQRRTIPLKVAVGCGMLLLEGYDAHADSGVRPAGGGNPGHLGGAGVATVQYQAQVHNLPFPGSKRCRCDPEL
jgi:hypothetical protein